MRLWNRCPAMPRSVAISGCAGGGYGDADARPAAAGRSRAFPRRGPLAPAQGLRAPAILAEDAPAGWVLLEDFGTIACATGWTIPQANARSMKRWPAGGAGRLPAGPFRPMTWRSICARRLLTEWYMPAMGLSVDEAGYDAAWEQVLALLLARQGAGITVLRDYHAENIMLLAGGAQGLLDFQDALAGHPAYDLVSLCRMRAAMFARSEAAMLDPCRPLSIARISGRLRLLGAQRNAKIVGIFVRLWQRDGKPRYLSLIPRVWADGARSGASGAGPGGGVV
jgi:aminoglycoside/choline kinase family phosphotransferase